MKYPGYEKYKESGIDWIGQVPENWIVKKIKWDTAVFRGASPRPIDDPIYFDDEGDYAWVRISDVTASGKFLEKTTQRLSALGASLSVKMQPKSLFLSIAGSVGKPCITNIKCCIHDGFVYFPFLKINQDFLYYIFASGESYKGLGKLGTQLNLNTETVGSISIAIPPSEEQLYIANFLDNETTRLDALIFKKQRLIETLKEKRFAIISNAVTKGLNPDVYMKNSGIEWVDKIPEHWSTIKLKWFSNIYSGGTPDKNNEDFWEDGTIPWINSGTVNQGYITSPSQYITKEALQFSSAKWIPKGALVMALAGQGKTKGMVAQLGIKTTCNQSMAAIIPDKRAHPRYIMYWLMINYQIIRNLGGGNQRDGLNLVMLGDIPCPIPPIEEQEKIASIIDSEEIFYKKLNNHTQYAIEKLQEYKTALISAAVTGKIKVPEQA
jgi:type I restriction enzyme S subunit